MSLSIRLFLIMILALVSSVSVSAAGKRSPYGSDWREFSEEPADSAHAENTRIWFSVEKRLVPRLQVDILDSSLGLVRHLLKSDMRKGYYNLYWDRKDDSGLWVDEGRYSYRLTYPERRKSGSLIVSYNEGERAVQLYPERAGQPGLISFDILADSAMVSAGVYLWRGNPIELSIVDSLMKKGRHEFRWKSGLKAPQGIYRFHVEAFGITHKVRISRPNEK